MKSIKILGLPIVLFIYLVISIPFQSCDPDDDYEKCDTCLMVYKPNIYIYPNQQINLSVKLNFLLGGEIVTSIPEYGNGWNVTVDTSSLIDNTYSYLFYESTQPDVWQRNIGWCIHVDNLESFFRNNMLNYGFNSKEIDDFIDYWIPRLEDYSFYSIYPQTKNIIDHVIQLDISRQPENILRLFYVIEGQNQIQNNLPTPTIKIFERMGYFVTEWGVILD